MTVGGMLSYNHCKCAQYAIALQPWSRLAGEIAVVLHVAHADLQASICFGFVLAYLYSNAQPFRVCSCTQQLTIEGTSQH